MSGLSRDAQIVASALFGLGPVSKAHFQRPHAIHPRTRTALDELVAAGMIEPMSSDECSRDGIGWKAAKNIGSPLRDFGHPTEDENFPLLSEESQ